MSKKHGRPFPGTRKKEFLTQMERPTAAAIPANVHAAVTPELLTGKKETVHGDSGCLPDSK
jgi:hypothetical protein